MKNKTIIRNRNSRFTDQSDAEVIFDFLKSKYNSKIPFKFTSTYLREIFNYMSQGSISGTLNKLLNEGCLKRLLDSNNKPVKTGKIYHYELLIHITKIKLTFHSKPCEFIRIKDKKVHKVVYLNNQVFTVEITSYKERIGLLTSKAASLKDILEDCAVQLEDIERELRNIHLMVEDTISIDLNKIPLDMMIKQIKHRRDNKLCKDSELKDLYVIRQ
jgi:hypothetical protein